MTVFQAIVLGLVQGLTEFLPVSSSGHLVIAQTILGFSTPPILFDVLVHVATLVAVVIYFRKRLLGLTKQQIFLAGVATIPAVIAGLVIEKQLEELFSSLWVVAIGLLFTSGLLLTTLKAGPQKRQVSELSWFQAVIIGLFQALAITPGVSRSGSTVAGGYLLHLKKEDAFFFSFLLAIPAISGAALLQLKDVVSFQQIASFPYLLGFVVASLSGLAALRILDLLIKKAKLHYFAVYCMIVAVSIILFQLKG